MLIDSCASGGRRDDLETMRRAVPLLRSDLENNPEAYQCHTYGFGLWLPYFDATNKAEVRRPKIVTGTWKSTSGLARVEVGITHKVESSQ